MAVRAWRIAAYICVTQVVEVGRSYVEREDVNGCRMILDWRWGAYRRC